MLNLVLIGLNESTSSALSMAMRNRAKGTCQISNADDADIALVDIDATTDSSQWKTLLNGRNIPLIAISQDGKISAQHQHEFQESLKKPLQFSALLSCVYRAGEIDASAISDLQHTSSASSKILDTSKKGLSAVPFAEKSIDPKDFLLGHVLSAIASADGEKYRLFEWSADQYLILNLPANKALFKIRKSVYRHLAILPMNKLDFTEQWITKQQLHLLQPEISWELCMEHFMWGLTQQTTRNRCLKQLHIDKPYKLRCWPDLAAYSTNQADIPIASYWVNHSSSITALAQTLSIPLEDVMTFASCCHACGFLEEQKESTAKSAPPPLRSGIMGVMSMILRKLGTSNE